MIDSKYCQLMAKYNHWQNANIIDIVANLDDEIWLQPKGLFFDSIDGTLNHLIYGDTVWLETFTSKKRTYTNPRQIIYPARADWIKARTDLDQQISDWANQVSDEWLDSEYSFFSNAYQKYITKPNWLFVTHFFNHQTHHRSQVTTALQQSGIKYGVTDLPWMPE